MSKLWISILKIFNKIGDLSGCHQIPDRSFKIKGYIFPICARCTGVIIGETISIILLIFNIRLNFVICIIMLAIMGLDWFIQYINILKSNNARRFITGLLGGYSIINIYCYVIKYIVNFTHK